MTIELVSGHPYSYLESDEEQHKKIVVIWVIETFLNKHIFRTFFQGPKNLALGLTSDSSYYFSTTYRTKIKTHEDLWRQITSKPWHPDPSALGE